MEYGARPLRRAIEHYLEGPLSEDLLRGTFQGKDTILVKLGPPVEGSEERRLVFDTSGGTETPELVGAGGEKK